MRAAGGLRRQIPADAAASQLGKAGRPAFPLLPGDGAQPSPGPLVKFAQHRRGLADAEVAAPSDEIGGRFFDDLREAFASSTARQLPDSAPEPGQRLRCDAPPRLFPVREAEARNLRVLGRATALLALLTFSLRRLLRNLSTRAITRSPAR